MLPNLFKHLPSCSLHCLRDLDKVTRPCFEETSTPVQMCAIDTSGLASSRFHSTLTQTARDLPCTVPSSWQQVLWSAVFCHNHACHMFQISVNIPGLVFGGTVFRLCSLAQHEQVVSHARRTHACASAADFCLCSYCIYTRCINLRVSQSDC